MAARAPLPPVALIDAPNCIGCALCLKACPTDAIVGAQGWLHTVIAADCIGCDKCLPVCPTDCITLEPRTDEHATPAGLAARWRARIKARKARLENEAREAAARRSRQRAALKK
jgi:electron transport complex protein RnfB